MIQCKVLQIYIPIWIDLKGAVGRDDDFSNLYLHSNMDRFERLEQNAQEFTEHYLHSNMDRFES